MIWSCVALQVGVDRRLEVGLAALDGRRGRDELLGQRVRDGGGAGRIGVLGGDGQERAVERRVGPDLLQELVGGHAETELRDDGVEDRPRRGHGRVRRGQALRDQDLGVVGVHGRERLADDERRLRLVGLRQLAADDERRAGGQQDARDQEREPCPNDGDLAPEVHGVSLSAPELRGAPRDGDGRTATHGAESSITTLGAVNLTICRVPVRSGRPCG